jgi:MFS family permease
VARSRPIEVQCQPFARQEHRNRAQGASARFSRLESQLNSHRSKVFYGWWVVFTAALGLGLGGAPITVFSFGVFFKSLVHDFHASRAAISFAFTLHNLIGAMCAALVGRLIDRFGARRVILPATAMFAMILLSGRVLGSSIWQFYLFYAALGLVGSSMSPVPYGVVVSHWFDRRRGLALGFMMFGVGLGAIVAPLLAQRLIGAVGWRMAYVIFGFIVLLIPLPVVAALLENGPAQRGLLPDGVEPRQRSSEQPQEKQGLSWHEIWHCPTFWLMICAFFLTGASVHAGVLHMPALLTDRGLSPERAAAASSVIGLSLLTGRLGSGYLLDRLFAPRVAIFFFGASALGMAILWAGSTGNVALAAAFLVGLGMGAEADIIAYLISRYFGLRAFGTAFGHSFAAFVLAGAFGTLLMGAGFDWTHSYTVPLAWFFAAMVVALGLLTLLGPYRYAAEPEESLPLERAQSASA